jgi:transposase
VTPAAGVSRLSVAEKDALILALSTQLATVQATIAAQEARIAGLEARLEQLTQPPKTPANSSKPPSQGQKRDRSKSDGERPPRKSRPGVGRTLHPDPDPDRVVDATLTHCPKCLARFPDAAQSPQQVYTGSKFRRSSRM